MSEHRIVAPAKLNLDLRITGRRQDGYHLLDSIVAFVDLYDTLAVSLSDTLGLSIDGPQSGALPVEPTNLVLRAARALQDYTKTARGGALQLTKHLPIGAGLGGGSSDAAACLLLLNHYWELDLGVEVLVKLAEPLGADVPACVHRQLLRMQGIGEHVELLTPMDTLPWVVLVKPEASLSTPAVYQHYATYSEAFDAERTFDGAGLDADYFKTSHNALQTSAIALCPQVQEVLHAIEQQAGCAFTRLCGSGSSCFGWFDERANAENAASAITESHPQWWVKAATLLSK